METTTKKILMASAVAGLLSVGASGAALADANEGGEGKKVHCYGVNKCKGTGACGGAHADGTPYSCHGNNGCKGQGFLEIDKETCLKIDGGRLTAKAEKKG